MRENNEGFKNVILDLVIEYMGLVIKIIVQLLILHIKSM